MMTIAWVATRVPAAERFVLCLHPTVIQPYMPRQALEAVGEAMCCILMTTSCFIAIPLSVHGSQPQYAFPNRSVSLEYG